MVESRIKQVEKAIERNRTMQLALLNLSAFDLARLSRHSQLAHREAKTRLEREAKALAQQLEQLKSEAINPCNL